MAIPATHSTGGQRLPPASPERLVASVAGHNRRLSEQLTEAKVALNEAQGAHATAMFQEVRKREGIERQLLEAQGEVARYREQIQQLEIAQREQGELVEASQAETRALAAQVAQANQQLALLRDQLVASERREQILTQLVQQMQKNQAKILGEVTRLRAQSQQPQGILGVIVDLFDQVKADFQSLVLNDNTALRERLLRN